MASKKSKERIIVVIDYNKDYLLQFFKEFSDKLSIYFLFYSYPKEVKENPKEHGQVIYWKDYKNAYTLLDAIKPNKVLFYELETLNQVALNIVCKNTAIKTFFADHGVQEFDISQQVNLAEKERASYHKKTKLARIFKFPILDIIKNRRFYNNTILKVNKEQADFLISFKKIRLNNTILDTYLSVKSNYLLADEYIVFSKENYKFHKILNHNALVKVNYIGIPEFDKFAIAIKKNNNTNTTKNIAIFIDQPYVNFEYYGWNKTNKLYFLNELKEACSKNGNILLIKKHPRESTFWDTINNDCFNYVSNEDLINLINKISFVIGYNSTLLFPFAAIEGIVVYCLNNHPDKKYRTSELLVENGVGFSLESVKSLSNSNIEIIRDSQNKKKSNFVNNVFDKFDGNSMKRFKNILLTE